MLKTYNKLSKLLITSIMLLAALSSMNAQSISVVVSSSSSNTPSKDEIISIFTAKKLTWSNSNRIIVVDQANNSVADKFYENFLGAHHQKVLIDWTKLVLSGQAKAPKKVGNDAEAKKEIASNPDAIGFISSDQVDGTLKEIYKIN